MLPPHETEQSREPGRPRRPDVAERLYRLLLHLYPAVFRGRHAEDMVDLMADLRRHELRQRGHWGAFWVTARTFAQLPASLLAAWRAPRHRNRDAPEAIAGYRRATEGGSMTRITTDLRDASRSLWKNAPFTAVGVLTLALGVGANTAIFSIVYGVLLRPLALADPESLVLFQTADESRGAFPGVSPGHLADWLEHGTSFDGLAAWVWDNQTLRTDDGEVEALDNVLAVTGNFLQVLGVDAMLGRALVPEDAPPKQRGNVVVLGEAFWRGHFAADPAILGRTLWLDGHPHEIVGVMPADVPLPPGVRMWFPQGFDREDESLTGRLMPVGRLREGVSREQAQAELERLAPLLARTTPQLEITSVALRPVLDALTGNARPALSMIAAAVGLVLLISCANLANLLLARASVREREMATRRALGASRPQIVSQLLTESLLLGLLGALAGVGLAVLGHRLVIATAPGILPRLDAVRLDLPVVLFSFGLSLVASLAFGIAPALHALAVDTGRALHSGSRGAIGSRAFSRARSALLVTQVAVAAMLLVGAGLLLRSLAALHAVDPGFEADGVVAARIVLDERAYDDPKEAAYFRALIERLREAPGITSVGACSGLAVDPVALEFEVGWERPDAPTPEGEAPPSADFRVATPGYFETMGMRLVEGRGFDDFDNRQSAPVVVVNRTLARQAWGNESAIERELDLRFGRKFRLRVVGVLDDVHSRGLAADLRPEVYVAHAQAPFSTMTIVVRGEQDAGGLIATLRSEALELDPGQPVEAAFPLTDLLADSLARDRFYTTALTLFALLAALLAAVGIYAVIAYWVNQSRKEIGVRLALGAARSSVVGMVVRRSLAVTAVGLALGLLGALASTRLMASMVFGIGLVDPVVLVGVALLLAVVAVVASLVPAHQASRLDPVSTLKLDG